MAKTVSVSLGGTDYQVPMLNIGQLERVTDALTVSVAKGPFAILKIALERATPKVGSVDNIEATKGEVEDAVNKLMVLSGFKTETEAKKKH